MEKDKIIENAKKMLDEEGFNIDDVLDYVYQMAWNKGHDSNLKI